MRSEKHHAPDGARRRVAIDGRTPAPSGRRLVDDEVERTYEALARRSTSQALEFLWRAVLEGRREAPTERQ